MANTLRCEERILVTGGSGFIGTNLVDYYDSLQCSSIVNIDLVPPRNPAHIKYYQKIDIRDEVILSEFLEKFSPTVVFHLAARTDLDGKRIEDYSSNIEGVSNLIECLKKNSFPPRMVVFASSRLVCKIGYNPINENDFCPTTIYGESKVIGERLVRDNISNEFEWIIVRPTSIWGPWFDVPYRTFFDVVSSHRYIHPYGKSILKSFGFVGNSVYQLDRLAFSTGEKVHRKTVYLCDYEPLEVGCWADLIAKRLVCAKPVRLPYFVLKFIAVLGDVYQTLLKRPAPLTSFRLDNLLTNMLHETNFVSSVVGPLPFDINESVDITCDWLKKNNCSS